jgi:hypothetical protein
MRFWWRFELYTSASNVLYIMEVLCSRMAYRNVCTEISYPHRGS